MASSALQVETLADAGADPEASGPALPPSVQTAAEIVAVTTEDDFLLELGAVLGGQAAVHPVDSVTAALAHMSAARRACILAIDTRGMDDLRDAVGRIFARAADAVIVLFAAEDAEENLRQAFATSRVFGVLPLPVDPARTALAVAAALADAVARLQAPAPAVADAPPIAAEPLPAPRKHGWALGAGLAVLVLAVAPWFVRRGTPPAAPAARPAIPAPAAPAPLVNGHIDELLEKARTAMADRRYTEPAADNALLYYRSAQASDPRSAEAVDGLARLAGLLGARFDEDLRQSQLDAAAVTLANLASAAPRDPRNAERESRLTAAKAHAELARREEQARLKHQAEVEAQSAREEQAAQRKERERGAALAAAAKAAQEKADEAAAAAARASAAQAKNSAPTTAADHPSLSQLQLKLVRYTAPEYPAPALARNLSGSVVVSYTVDLQGATRDVRVLSAEPAHIFDRSAVEAVQRWRYAPVVVDGAAIAVPTRTTIQFTPK
ncbi:MAG TPA: energy transducer TonB [Steroidobacteraceae bacterium]|nr:energy transducer TonB [Steroidobacteraceae bacterium]